MGGRSWVFTSVVMLFYIDGSFLIIRKYNTFSFKKKKCCYLTKMASNPCNSLFKKQSFTESCKYIYNHYTVHGFPPARSPSQYHALKQWDNGNLNDLIRTAHVPDIHLKTSGSMKLNTPKTISLLHLKKAGCGGEF